jgi:HAE1 family hydrophobic/amphiphilic exporter-1
VSHSGAKNTPRLLGGLAGSALLVMALLICGVGSTSAATALTLKQARAQALQHNRDLLSAKQDVRLAETNVDIALSDALPHLRLDAGYTRNIESPSFFFYDDQGNSTEIRTATDNAYQATLSLRQPIWQGGKVFTAYAISKLYRRYTDAIAQQVEDNVLYHTDVLFFQVMLDRAILDTYRAAHANNVANLEVVEKKFEQGLVSRYELLRARVEKANLEPMILQAESVQRLSEKRLKSFLGLNLQELIDIIEPVADTSIAGLPPMTALVDSALARRPESQQSELVVDIAHKAIRIARGGYFPNIDFVSAYQWQGQSEDFNLNENNSRAWTAGIQLSFPFFEGGRTRAEVGAARADHNKARLNAAQVHDNVRLEVEAAYDRLIQAKKSLDAQVETIAQADEGLRIATLSYDQGVGTQLEMISAQTALTQARQSLAQALFSFRQARSDLKRATTLDIESLLER